MRPALRLAVLSALACCSRPVLEGPTLGEDPDLLGANITQEIQNGAFFLGPGDQVQINFWMQEDLQQTAEVGPTGLLDCYLVGPQPVSGLSVQELDERLTEAYARYLVDPSLVVRVSPSPNRKVTVLGSVNRPGVFPLTTPRTSVLDVVALAGGVNPEGEITGVVVARQVQGQWQVVPYSLDLMFNPDDPRIKVEIPYVQPGDYVYVLRTTLSQFDEYINVIAQAMRSVVYAERALLLGPRVSEAINR